MYLQNTYTNTGLSGLINCTIASNRTETLGGGIYLADTNNFLVNCIVSSNVSTGDAYDDLYHVNAFSTNNYWYTCAPTNLAPNQGNITGDPLFVDRANNNYRLSANSPCVNTGTNMNWMTNAFDLDGGMRIRYGTVDMGTYEYIYEGTIYTAH